MKFPYTKDNKAQVAASIKSKGLKILEDCIHTDGIYFVAEPIPIPVPNYKQLYQKATTLDEKVAILAKVSGLA